MKDTECSYKGSEKENRILASVLFSLGAVGLISAAVGVGLIRSFGLAFGVVTVEGRRGVIRYMGYDRGVLNDIRRQNEISRQERLDNQARNQTLPPGLQGFTNFGFEPPSPPPYSQNDVQVSIISNGQTSPITTSNNDVISDDPPKYSDIELTVVTNELPPPYTESAQTSDGRSENGNTKL